MPGIDAQEAFDGALANIVARVIAERAPALARALRPGAWLVASGIIAEREAEASGPLEAQGFRTERRLQRGDWVTLLCRRPWRSLASGAAESIMPTVHRFHVPGPLEAGLVDLPGPAAHQVLSVLRLRPGAPLVLFDGRGGEWSATIAGAGRDGVTARLLQHHTPAREAAIRVTLAQAVLKSDRFEWLLQKGTELGVVAFQPLLTRRTVAVAHGALGAGKLERWGRIVTEAAEQSGRCLVPRVWPPAPLEAILAASTPSVLLWEGERERPFTAALREAAGGQGARFACWSVRKGGSSPRRQRRP